jgi:uncharacterized protein YyaL (SSP411 family)
LWLADPRPLYARVVSDTAAWVMREMQAPAGGYYSSIDADSEHVEGKFYVWTPDAVKTALTAEEFAVVEPHLGLDARPNFERVYWHLRVTKPLAAVARQLEISEDRARCLLDGARAKLLATRELRVRPERDEKILTSWNALMVKGMARAARVFGTPAWLDSARHAVEFLRACVWRNGRLLATCKDGNAHLNAYLDDYAFLLDALIELMQHDFRAADLEWARALADVLLEQFEDPAQGGFFFVSHDHERLFYRAKSGQDHAAPAGNGIAALALNRLGHMVGEAHYCEAARRTLYAFKSVLAREPHAHTSLCAALEEELTPPDIVVLRGGSDSAAWQREINRRYLPHAVVVAVPAGVAGLPPALDKSAGDRVNAWVCTGVTCLAPITERAALLATLSSRVA